MSDTFESIIKSVSSPVIGTSGVASTSPSGTYFQVANNLSEGSASTIRSNIGVEIGTDVQAWDAQLDTLSGLSAGQASDLVAITEAEYTQIQNIDSVTITNTQWGYVGAMDQGVATTDAVTFATVNTGQGANELYAMDQDVQTTDAVTFATVNTGQGNNELYAMDQDVQTTDTVDFNQINLATLLDLDDTNGRVASTTFNSGFSGDGVQLDKTASGNWELTVDDIVVRRLARFYEIVVEQIRANAGTLIVSPGAEKVTSVTQIGDATWTFNDTITPFASSAPDPYYSFANHYEAGIEEDKLITMADNDLIRRQEWNGRGTGVTKGTVFAVEGGSATPTDNSTPRTFTFFTEADSDTPQVGHEYAVIGNTTNADRQGLILLTSSDTDAPYRRIMSGIDSHAKFGDISTIKNQDGRLDGLDVSTQFAELDGTQTNLFGSYWDGNVYINDGNFRGTVTITDTDASNAATKQYVDDTQGGNVTIRAASEPTVRLSGEPIDEGDQWIDTSDGNKPYTYDGTDPFDVSGWVRDYTIIDGGELINGSVDTNQLATDAVTADKILAGAVTATKINVTNLEAVNTSTGNLTVDGTFTISSGGNIVLGSVFDADGTAGTVQMAGYTADATHFYTDDGASGAGTFTGIQAGTGVKQFFSGADDKDGLNADFYVQDGKIFYDGLGGVVWSRTEVATFGDNDSAPAIDVSEWQNSVAVGGNTAGTSVEDDKIRTVIQKRFGEDKLVVSGIARKVETTGGGGAGVTHTATVKAYIDSQNGAEATTGSTEITDTSGSGAGFSFEVDISAIPDGDTAIIRIALIAFISVSSYDSGTYGTDIFLREDTVIRTTNN